MTGEEIPPKPVSETFSEIVILFAEKWNTTPFDVLSQDIDDFILVVNAMISKGQSKPIANTKTQNKEERIRVNDKTATGGWF